MVVVSGEAIYTSSFVSRGEGFSQIFFKVSSNFESTLGSSLDQQKPSSSLSCISLMVISKGTIGNSCDNVNAIWGHKYQKESPKEVRI